MNVEGFMIDLQEQLMPEIITCVTDIGNAYVVSVCNNDGYLALHMPYLVSTDGEISGFDMNSKKNRNKLNAGRVVYTDSTMLKNKPEQVTNKDGGSGSGNWGHEGRPGKIGGSSEGGGAHNRQTDKSGNYTSFSKKQKAAAKPHKTNWDEIKDYPVGTVVKFSDGTIATLQQSYMSPDKKYLVLSNGGVVDDKYATNYEKFFSENDAKAAIPDSENRNYRKQKGVDIGKYREQMSSAWKAETAEQFDDKYREQSGEIWQGLSSDAKKAFAYYTGLEYRQISQTARGERASNDTIQKVIGNLTDAIDKSEIAEDTILERGCSSSSVDKLFGLDKHAVSAMIANGDASTLIGKSGTDDGFLSCSSNGRRHNFKDKDVLIEILCPQGTKAMYVEPFSECGRGGKSSWDGKSKQERYSKEDETIIQRGSTLTIIDAKVEGDQVKMKCAVTRQKHD